MKLPERKSASNFDTKSEKMGETFYVEKTTKQGTTVTYYNYTDINNFEDLLKICGDGGWWQLRIFLLTSFSGFALAFQNLVYAFIGAVPDHWCSLPNISNYSIDELKNLTIPLDKNGDFESCTQYQYDYLGNESIGQFNVNRSIIESCDSIDFDNSIYTSTAVTEFNLICGSSTWTSVIQSIYMVGIIFGGPIIGSISDKFGRRYISFILSIIFALATFAVGLSPNFATLIVARFILGAATLTYSICYVLIVEFVGPDWRGIVGNLYCLPFAAGYMVLPGIAYFFRNWRHLQLVLAAPSIIQIFFCWITSESPRWLLSKGRTEEADKILRKAARTNGVLLPKQFTKLVEKVADHTKVQNPDTDVSFLKSILITLKGYTLLYKTSNLRKRTLVLSACWVSISMVYYGVALNSPNLSADTYLYMFLSGVLELPSYGMVPPLIKYLGRRKVFSGFLLICGTSLLSSLAFTQESAFIVVLALFGKLLIGAAYALIYLYASELMPTVLRSYGTGTIAMFGRIGSASAPFIVDLMGREKKTLPTLVFGVASVFAGFLSLLLPETRNKKLPETVSDVEDCS